MCENLLNPMAAAFRCGERIDAKARFYAVLDDEALP